MTSYQPTSYFSNPVAELDPTLFQGRELRSWVRSGVNQTLYDFLGKKFRHAELWAHPWLAGSGVSYQWAASREPRDLDCLVGVDFIQFRQANPEYRGLLDSEIADQMNEDFRNELQETTENWNGYELTFYVNPRATDITNIKPYAAYDLKYNEWTVPPNPTQEAPQHPEWDSIAVSDYTTAHQAYVRATKAMQDLEVNTSSGPQHRNSQAALQAAYQQANALYTDIHSQRSEAFSPTGQGYNDFYNYRWQAAKRSGAIDLLREIRNATESRLGTDMRATYGVEFPDASTLIRRAALYRSN